MTSVQRVVTRPVRRPHRTKVAQAEIPETFSNRWFVGGAAWETPWAGRKCEVVRYEDACSVRVRFTDWIDLFEPREAVMSPHMLFPVRAGAGGCR